jgi:hypothetical protein
MTSTSVVLTTQTTTKTITSQPTTTTRLPLTTLKPAQSSSTVGPTIPLSELYRINLLMVVPELDGQPIMDILLASWSAENKGMLVNYEKKV